RGPGRRARRGHMLGPGRDARGLFRRARGGLQAAAWRRPRAPPASGRGRPVRADAAARRRGPRAGRLPLARVLVALAARSPTTETFKASFPVRPRLLILRALKLGDLLTSVPALRGLARAFPSHERIFAGPAWLE